MSDWLQVFPPTTGHKEGHEREFTPAGSFAKAARAPISSPSKKRVDFHPFISSRLASTVNFAKQVRGEETESAEGHIQPPAQSRCAQRPNLFDPTIFPTIVESPGERHAHHGILTSSFNAPSVCQNPAFGTLPFSAFTNSTTTFAPSGGSLVPRYPLNSVLQ
jgi:hypothetical protein